MFKKSYLFLVLLSALIFSFNSCTKKAPKDDYQKPVLEVSFSPEITYVPLSYLTSVIGTGSGETETFGEKKSMLLYFEEEGCSTCEKVRPAVNDWVRLAGCTIYGYKENSANSLEERKEFLKKLGSEDGVELTAGRLIAFVDGVRRNSIAGTYDLQSAQNVDIFARRFFAFPDKEEFLNFDRKQISGLRELRELVSSNKKFLLYVQRHSCPDCRRLADPQAFDSISEILKNCNIPLYAITTEDTLVELYQKITVDEKTYQSSLDYLEESGSSALLWPQKDTDKKKAEYLEMITALGMIPPHPGDDAGFLKSIDDFAQGLKEGTEDRLLWSDRFVPAFCFVTDAKNNTDDALQALKKAYQAEKKENLPHKANFPCYFSLDNSIVDKDLYNSHLLKWSKSCLYIN